MVLKYINGKIEKLYLNEEPNEFGKRRPARIMISGMNEYIDFWDKDKVKDFQIGDTVKVGYEPVKNGKYLNGSSISSKETTQEELDDKLDESGKKEAIRHAVTKIEEQIQIIKQQYDWNS